MRGMDWLLAYFALPLIAYLIGAIPVGYLLVRTVRGVDVRTVGELVDFIAGKTGQG